MPVVMEQPRRLFLKPLRGGVLSVLFVGGNQPHIHAGHEFFYV